MVEDKKEIVMINEEMIKNRIYYIRNQKVMLDFELAEIYGYTTTRFNEQVKNNSEKFDEDFRFQLTKDEWEVLKSKFSTSKSENGNLISKKSTSSWGGRRKLPYAFTEQGIYMLMTVLKGELAITQSKALIRLFKRMKDFIVENQNLTGSKELVQISIQTNLNTKDIVDIKKKIVTLATKEDLKKVMENFIDPDTYKHFLLMNGEKIEADLAYSKIYKSAKKTIFVVDNYIGLKTLELLREAKENVSITIFSDNIQNRTMLTKSLLQDFQKDYPKVKITFQKTNGKYHDRYIAIDYNKENETIYHCGASSKDAGDKVTTISRIDDKIIYHPMFDELLKNKPLII